MYEEALSNVYISIQQLIILRTEKPVPWTTMSSMIHDGVPYHHRIPDEFYARQFIMWYQLWVLLSFIELLINSWCKDIGYSGRWRADPKIGRIPGSNSVPVRWQMH